MDQIPNISLTGVTGSSSPFFAHELVRNTSWNPFESSDWDNETVSPHTYLRIKRDLSSLYSDPLPGVFVVPEDGDITKLHALITGSFDTPYEGGFFYFVIRCPPDYPIRPPRIKMMTTANDTVRFNPNIYRNGKICLSILGTWAGPSWSPALTLSSVLLSIQSLMNDKPYHNEPGFGKNDRSFDPSDVSRYNEIVTHETIRVAVCDMLENANNDSVNCPKPLKEAMEKSFVEYYQHYEDIVKSKIWMSNQLMNDPFGEDRGSFDYNKLLNRLQILKQKFNVTNDNSDPDSDLE